METSDKRCEVAENLRRLDDGAIVLIDERMNRLTNEMLARSAVPNFCPNCGARVVKTGD